MEVFYVQLVLCWIDSLNEGIILKSLKEDKANRTVVLVSHRTSTMKVAECGV